MPARLDRCVRKLKGKKGIKSAWAICKASFAGTTKKRRKRKR